MTIDIGSVSINRIPVGPVHVLTAQQFDPSLKNYLLQSRSLLLPRKLIQEFTSLIASAACFVLIEVYVINVMAVKILQLFVN